MGNKPILKLANFRLLKLLAQWVLSVSIPPLVGGINNTKGFIHYIHNVSFGNWQRFDHVSNLLPQRKRRKQENITYFPCWKNSVTEVMFVVGIGSHLKVFFQDISNHRALIFNGDFLILSKVHMNCHRHRNICTMWDWSLEEALEIRILSKKLDLWNLLCRSLTFLVKRNDESDDDDSSGWLIVCIKSKMTSCSKFPYWVIGHVSTFFSLVNFGSKKCWHSALWEYELWEHLRMTFWTGREWWCRWWKCKACWWWWPSQWWTAPCQRLRPTVIHCSSLTI